jgi:hypothetical protein
MTGKTAAQGVYKAPKRRSRKGQEQIIAIWLAMYA